MREHQTDGLSPETKDVIADVYEFLKWSSLDRTSSTLLNECYRDKNFDLKAIAKSVSNFKASVETRESIIEAFEDGDSEDFWELWATAMPEADPGTTQDVLEFLLRVYFATEPLRQTNPRRNSHQAAVNNLKSVVENAHELSDVEELVPYFRLPFMDQPQNSSLFKELTQEKWSRNVKRKLEHQLATIVLEPKLLVLWRDKENDKSTSSSSREGKDTEKMNAKIEEKLANSERVARSYKNRHAQMQQDYHKLIGIATELVDALEQTFKGSPVSPEYFEDISTRLLESTKQHLNSQSPKTKTEKVKDEPPPKSEPPPPKMEIFNLNYSKIRTQLNQQPNSRESAFLLQALRQQLTKCSPEQRVTVLENYASNDLLGLKGAQNATSSVLNCESHESKQSMARLLNGLASTKAGRNYLTSVSQGKNLLSTVASALKTRKVADFSQGHCLAALQKLSLRRRVQVELIRLGTVDWLVQFLTNFTRLADYSLEYGTALLMNLSLNSAGKQAASKCSENLVKLLISLLKHNNTEIHPYINGILYSTLSIPKIRTKARDLGMEGLLESAMRDAKTKEDSKQLPYVLKQLRGELGEQAAAQSSDDESTNEEEDTEEEDYLESELDSTDSLKTKAGELCGENLLKQRYKATPHTGGTPTVSRRQAASKPIENPEAPPGIVPQDLPLEPGYQFERTSVSRGTYTVQNDTPATDNKAPARFYGASAPGKTLSNPTLRKRSRSPQGAADKPPKAPVDPPSSPQKKPTTQTNTQRNCSRKGAVSDTESKKQLAPPVPQESAPNARMLTATIARGRTPAVAARLATTNQEASASPPTRRTRPLTARNKNSLPTTKTEPKQTEKPKDSGRNTADRPPPAPAAAVSAIQWAEEAGVSAPVVGRMNTRIPGKSEEPEYIAAFGSRPKVSRTPDKESLKQRNLVMFF